MKRLFAVALAAALSGPALADPAPPAYSLMSMKISVSDFARSTAFYTKYFGMKEGALYNPAEKALDWPEPGQGSNIIMVHDETGKLKGPPTSWLMFKVPDAKKIAAELTEAGFKGVEPPQETPQYKTVIVMARDPDGNTIEMMQIGGAK
jgi:predicted enzyme related to lactoylglutathione lyase